MAETSIDWSRVVAGAGIWVQAEGDPAPRVFRVLSPVKRRDDGFVHCRAVGEEEAVMLPRGCVLGFTGPHPRPAGVAMSYPPLRLVAPLPEDGSTGHPPRRS
jgi:hypothetical protein